MFCPQVNHTGMKINLGAHLLFSKALAHTWILSVLSLSEVGNARFSPVVTYSIGISSETVRVSLQKPRSTPKAEKTLNYKVKCLADLLYKVSI